MAGKPVLYCSWFCPFAQRAWIALEVKGVPYEYKEIDPYNKTPEFLAVNPRGLVPALVDDGKSVYESVILLEYIDEKWPDVGPALFPKSPFDRAVARTWMDHVNKRVTAPFYRYLQRQDPAEQEQAKNDMLKGVEDFCKAMEDIGSSGPFFFGDKMGAVDITLAPWSWRMENVLKHYRGFAVPDSMARYHTWWSAAKTHPSFKATLCDEDRLIGMYERYAKNTATSLVALATNAGHALP